MCVSMLCPSTAKKQLSQTFCSHRGYHRQRLKASYHSLCISLVDVFVLVMPLASLVMANNFVLLASAVAVFVAGFSVQLAVAIFLVAAQ